MKHIINLSLKNGAFPDQLKIAKVRPIHKSGRKDTVNNYRPISLLPCISKLFERVIANRMVNYLDNFDILNQSQFGFRKKHSTEHALLQLTNYIVSNQEKNKFVIGLSMDLSKAFDRINHRILLEKLHHIGFRGPALFLIKSYLESRKQQVWIGNVKSSSLFISQGVPQGSILGPILFLIYINDLKNAAKHVDMIQYADDTTALISGHNLNNAITYLNEDMSQISQWLKANDLILNHKKTKCIFFGTKKMPPTILPIIIDNVNIERVDSLRFLGVQVDHRLSWRDHLEMICDKISKGIAILHRVHRVFTTGILKTLYFSFVYPYINYCNLVWGNAPTTCLRRLYILQKKAIKLIFNLPFLTPTTEVFSRSKLLPLDMINSYQAIIFMFKFENQLLPKSFHNWFIRNQQHHSRVTRSSDLFHIPRVRTERIKRTIIYSGPITWNSLPSALRSLSCTLSTFKLKVKEHLIQNSLPQTISG